MKEMGVEGSGGGGLEDMMKNLLSSINPSCTLIFIQLEPNREKEIKNSNSNLNQQ